MCVTCNLPCYGDNIPSKYGHTGTMVNAIDLGLTIEGWTSPVDGSACYFALVCDVYNKLCATRDERLKQAARSS